MKRHYCTFCGAKRNENQMNFLTHKLLKKSGYVCKSHTSTGADILDIRQNKQPVWIEIFSGSGKNSEIARSRGYQTITIDIEKKFNPDICIDIINLRRSLLPKNVDVVWASIPCTVYSILNLESHWDKISIGYRQYYYVPKTKEAREALRILNKTISLIVKLNPIYFFLENPRGALRHFPQMKFVPFRKTVSYADYGFEVYKPTDIFTNCKHFQPKPIAGCVGKKFDKYVHEMKDAYERSLVPPDLLNYLFDSIDFISSEKKGKSKILVP